MDTREISASRFRATCLKLLDDIARSGDELIVTKRGRPVAKVVPVESPEELRAPVRDDLRGSITYLVDDDELLEPVATE